MDELKRKFEQTKLYTLYERFKDNLIDNKWKIICSIVVAIVLSSIITMELILHYISVVLIPLYWLVKGKLLFTIILGAEWFIMLRFKIMTSLSTGKFDEERNYIKSESGLYGTATEMELSRQKEIFEIASKEEVKGTIFGTSKYDYSKLFAQKKVMFLNKNMIIVGGPGSGKSASMIIAMLFQIIARGESAIVSDPKGELFKFVSEIAKMCGYEVRILNLNPPFLDNSDACNIMAHVTNATKARTFAATIIDNTAAVKDFWAEGAENALVAIVLLIVIGDRYPKEKKTIVEVYKFLKTHTDVKSFELEFSNLPSNHPALGPFSFFKGGEPKVKGQVLQGLGYKLAIFNDEKIQKIMGNALGSINMLNPGRKKCMYFVGSNDQEASMAYVLALFYTLLYQELVLYADQRNPQELPVPVHMVLDEYANMGSIPAFEKKLSTVRSRNIITTIVLQDINQAKTKHPMDTWKTVVNDCDYFLLLKTNDSDTANWFAELSGDETLEVNNVKTDEHIWNIFKLHQNYSNTKGYGKRSLYTMHEVRTLSKKHLLLVVSGENIIKLRKFYWKDHPFAKYVNEVLPTEHYPLWKLVEDGVVDKNFDYDNSPTIRMEQKKVEEVIVDKNYNALSMLKQAGKERGIKVEDEPIADTDTSSSKKDTTIITGLLNKILATLGKTESVKVMHKVPTPLKDIINIMTDINANGEYSVERDEESTLKNENKDIAADIEKMTKKNDTSANKSENISLKADIENANNEHHCEENNNQPDDSVAIPISYIMEDKPNISKAVSKKTVAPNQTSEPTINAKKPTVETQHKRRGRLTEQVPANSSKVETEVKAREIDNSAFESCIEETVNNVSESKNEQQSNNSSIDDEEIITWEFETEKGQNTIDETPISKEVINETHKTIIRETKIEDEQSKPDQAPTQITGGTKANDHKKYQFTRQS